MAKVQPKSNWGGRRKGAGRPANPDSIRQQFKEAREKGYNHSHTKYEVERGTFISEHGCPLLFLLHQHEGENKKPLLSINAAWRIAHFGKEMQPTMLAITCPDKLWYLVDKYKDSQDPRERGYAAICYNALNE